MEKVFTISKTEVNMNANLWKENIWALACSYGSMGACTMATLNKT